MLGSETLEGDSTTSRCVLDGSGGRIPPLSLNQFEETFNKSESSGSEVLSWGKAMKRFGGIYNRTVLNISHKPYSEYISLRITSTIPFKSSGPLSLMREITSSSCDIDDRAVTEPVCSSHQSLLNPAYNMTISLPTDTMNKPVNKFEFIPDKSTINIFKEQNSVISTNLNSSSTSGDFKQEESQNTTHEFTLLHPVNLSRGETVKIGPQHIKHLLNLMKEQYPSIISVKSKPSGSLKVDASNNKARELMCACPIDTARDIPVNYSSLLSRLDLTNKLTVDNLTDTRAQEETFGEKHVAAGHCWDDTAGRIGYSVDYMDPPEEYSDKQSFANELISLATSLLLSLKPQTTMDLMTKATNSSPVDTMTVDIMDLESQLNRKTLGSMKSQCPASDLFLRTNSSSDTDSKKESPSVGRGPTSGSSANSPDLTSVRRDFLVSTAAMGLFKGKADFLPIEKQIYSRLRQLTRFPHRMAGGSDECKHSWSTWGRWLADSNSKLQDYDTYLVRWRQCRLCHGAKRAQLMFPASSSFRRKRHLLPASPLQPV